MFLLPPGGRGYPIPCMDWGGLLSVSLLTSQVGVGGWDPIPCGGTPFNAWIGGEGGEGGNIIPGCFYGLNRNGYGNVIFSVSLLTFQVGVGGGTPCGGMGPHPTWGGPHSMLGLGGGGGNIIPGCFYGLNRNGYRNVIFSVSLLTSQVGVGGVGPHPMWGDHIPGTGGGVL